MKAARPWQVASSPVPSVVPGVRYLSAAWHNELVRRGIYTREEMDALETPPEAGRACSWAASPELLAGPLTLIARSRSRVVAGVELWQQQRDHFWFLEGLVRNQAPSYKGVGAEVAMSAIAWLSREAGEAYGVRVYAMAREAGAVEFWTDLVGHVPDFDDAFVRTADYYFPAVGWIIVSTPASTLVPTATT